MYEHETATSNTPTSHSRILSTFSAHNGSLTNSQLDTMRWLLPKRGSSLRLRPEPRLDKWADQRFDKSTGQIYTETICSIQTTNDREWTRRCCVVDEVSHGGSELYTQSLSSWQRAGAAEDGRGHQKSLDETKNSRVKSTKGARALRDFAIECILQNISDVTCEGIECLPTHIVRQLWYAINKRSVWLNLQANYPTQGALTVGY